MSFIVTSDAQYYPEVHYFETREEADRTAAQLAEDSSYIVGGCRVVVAEVLSTITVTGQKR